MSGTRERSPENRSLAEPDDTRSTSIAVSATGAPGIFLFLQRELVDVDITDPEALGASGQVLDVAVVDLVGLDGDRLLAVLLQRLRPQIQRAGVVRLQ